MKITIAWWNTSLSPCGKPRATDDEKKIAGGIINHLIQALQVDCLALGEISVKDLSEIAAVIKSDEFEIFDGTIKSGRLQFETGVLYRKTKLGLLDHRTIIDAKGDRQLKVANRLDFLLPACEIPLHLFISHWPSRIWCKENDADRHFLGLRLRDAITELNGLYGKAAQTILLGDYNDEPYDSSLAEQLLATRDRRLVAKKSFMLYNPFWRRMGEAFPHIPNSPANGYSGSCYHSKGNSTKWRTFDQIIFSSAFLGSGEWHLKEEQTKILQLEPLANLMCSGKTVFDHFPVISVIEKGVTNG